MALLVPEKSASIQDNFRNQTQLPRFINLQTARFARKTELEFFATLCFVFQSRIF